MAEPRTTEGATADRARTSSALGNYQPSLDGLRAVAMAVMLSYHGELQWAKGAYLGLSQFFTLSGFLITSILLSRQTRHGSVGLGRFWSNRYRRLLPAAMLTLAGVVVFGATVADPVQVKEIPAQIAAAAAQVANWYFIVTDKSYVELFVSPSPVQHFWSLAVEEQFYLIMPLLFVGLFKLTKSLKVVAACFAGGAVVSTVWMIWLYRNGASIDRLYYGTDTRAAELLMGGLLAVILHRFPLNLSPGLRKVMAAAGIAAFALTAWGWTHLEITSGPMYQGGFLVFSVVSCVIIASLLSGGPLTTALSWGFLPAMGRIIYGLYLYHWPIFLWLTAERTGLDPWPLFFLRMVVTFVLAIASYNLVEMPIRHGSFTWLKGPVRYAVAPVVAVSIVLVAFIAGNREVTEELTPLATPVSEQAPIVGGDGVLDVVVIGDATTQPFVDRLEEVAATSDALAVTVAPPFACDGLVEVDGGPTCANFVDDWTPLIDEVDPDVVLFYVTAWDVASTATLAGLAPAEPTATVEWAQGVLDRGMGILSARGAPVVWGEPSQSFEQEFRNANDPFHLAIAALLKDNQNVRQILGIEYPTGLDVTSEAYVDGAVEVILENLRRQQRDPAGAALKVLVVGDSVARTFGFGLERWASETGTAAVWTTATPGCGVTDEGTTRGLADREQPIPEVCRSVREGWVRQIAQFDPDLVIVLTSVWDVQDRRFPGWSDYRSPGDPELDAYILREYEESVDVLSSGGATVVWLQAPCSRSMQVDGGAIGESAGAYEVRRVVHLNDSIIPKLLESRPAVRTFDLFPILCPSGGFEEQLDGIEPRPDGAHFSVEGAMWIAETYGKAVLEAGVP